jgi:kinesin family member 4
MGRMSAGGDVSVKVAVRIRPLVPAEVQQACERCLEKVKGEPQVVLGGGDKAFTFDQVYDSGAPQEVVYQETVQPLLESFFQGINVTVFAYGQTGSGKTHTMGTNDGKVAGLEEITESAGIIPRIVAETFERIEMERASGTAMSHVVKVSFLEIHNDDIHDLLDSTPKTCTLREDSSGAVLVSGLEEFSVASSRELLECLGRGSQNRATASTCMNAVSSRSHAVFTITMEKTFAGSAPTSSDDTPPGPDGAPGLDGSAVIARMHLVDLAGSERAKRTKAEGQRLKEGININRGLLALGNVISALTLEGGSGGHVPYRDSKLTRMLQDSLGGNSRTVMIACVSPADSNFEETLNTLKYANRAKNIKNKAVINVSSSNAEIASLRAQVLHLEALLNGAGGAGGGGGGTGMVMVDGERVRALEEEVRRLNAQLHQLSLQASRKAQRALALEISNDRLRLALQQHGIIDIECSINDSRQSMGEGGGRTSLEGEDSAAFSLDVTGLVGMEDAACDGSGGVSAGTVVIQHTMQQAAMSDELHTIEESLGLKEKLLEQLQEGERRMQFLKAADEEELRRLQEELQHLQQERDELRRAASDKSKLTLLEEQLSAMRRRVQESERALRLKHDSDRRIQELRNDIDSMKKSKVDLLRKMKSDTDRFREWRAEQQKEVTCLKRQQKQAEYQLHKMQEQLDKQQGVLKRKMEEANTANMRLKSLLNKKESAAKASAAPKSAAVAAGGDGKGEEGAGLEEWMAREVQFCVEVRRVRNLLSEQMKHRSDINVEMCAVKEQLAAASEKEAEEDASAAAGGGGGNALKEKLAALQNQWKARQGIKVLSGKEQSERLSARMIELEANVHTCSEAIGKLQRALLEVEGNNDRERNVALNCPHLRSIQDTKKAVRYLFSAAVKAEMRASDAAGEGADKAPKKTLKSMFDNDFI